MSHHETSKALAIAIGWSPFHIHDYIDKSGEHNINCLVDGEWVPFDYRDPLVIWPIAKRFNCFPWRDSMGYWWANVGDKQEENSHSAELAVALAVIGAMKL